MAACTKWNGLLLSHLRQNIFTQQSMQGGIVKSKHANVYLLLRCYREYGTNAKLLTEMDKELLEAIENKEVQPRSHPGVIKIRTKEVPSKIKEAVQKILQDHPVDTLRKQGESLTRYLMARHLPAEPDELKQKRHHIQQALEMEHGIDSSNLGDDERELLTQNIQGEVLGRLRKVVYSWQPIAYDKYNSLQYLVGRSAAEYAILLRIFTEMKTRISDFKPQSVLDFGSGVGTVSWAANTVWGSSIREYFNVDSSGEMNDLASLLLKDGNINKDLPKGVYYRQFLPSSHDVKYDIAVSAFSLFELPSMKSRLETILNLWNKTQGYLVLVELGTNAGFKVINEARDFILHVSESNRTSESPATAHVFAPCPHDLPCPRIFTSKIPCNFETSFLPLSIGNKSELQRERFSYVILKKGPRSVDDLQWPRLVSPTLVRTKHAICRMCLSKGIIGEVVFTASRHGKIPYRCAKASRWGDLLPINIHDSNVDTSSSNIEET